MSFVEKYKTYILIGFCLLFWSIIHQTSYAQVPGFTLRHIGGQNGLPSSEITVIKQDHKGFVWIGTNSGLSRYDGYQFENFQYYQQQRLGAINSLREFADKSLWICTETGLFVYRNNKITKVLFDDNAAAPFFDIVEKPAGGFFISGAKDLFEIPKQLLPDIQNGKPLSLNKYITTAWANKKEGREWVIQNLAINSSEVLAIGTPTEAYMLEKTQLKKIWEAEEVSDDITGIHITDQLVVSWTSSRIGLKRYEKGTVEDLSYPNVPGLYGGYDYMQKGDSLIIFSATNLFSYHPAKKTIRKSVSLYPLDIKWCTAILVDNDGNYWLGSHEGIYFLKKNHFTLLDNSPFQKVQETYSLLEKEDGTMLAGTNRGHLWKLTDSTATIAFKNDPFFSRAEIFALLEDERHWLWLGSGYQGLCVIKDNKPIIFKEEDGLADNSILNLITDSKKNIWAIGDNGITKVAIDPANNIHLQKFNYTLANKAEYKLFSMIEGPDGNFWLAGMPGVLFFDGQKISPAIIDPKLPKEFSVRKMIKDKTGNVWIATFDYGLLLCYFDNQHQLKLRKIFDESDGLFTNTVTSLEMDKNDNLWLGGYKGISCIQIINDRNFQIRNFDSEDGFLPNNYHSLTLYANKKGIIWTASSAGIGHFNPEELLANSPNTTVYITKVNLLNHDSTISLFSAGSGSLNKDSIELQLPYSYNSLSINFSGIHFSNPESLRYYYRLNKEDSIWKEIKSGNSITFQQLGAGKYTLLLKATIGGNISSAITYFHFQILPPFWQTAWFIAILLAAIIAIVLFIIKRRDKIIRQRESQKTEIQKLKAISFQYQLEIEQVIGYFASSINEQPTIDQMLWDVAKNCIAKLGFEDCVIYLKDETKNKLVQKAAWGPKTTDEDKIVNPIEIELGTGIVGAVALSGKATIINDTSADTRYIVDDAIRYSEITVPILDNGKVIGIIDSEHHEKNFYTDRHLQILTTIASLCADKMDKMNAEQLTREKELELVTLNKDLATSQLTALRAQMNPHFIFNALNSVQQFILKGDVDQANRYLSKFSRLQREVLNNSDQNFISLEKEIEILTIYLELEQLRFNENFDYSILLDEEMDPEELKIPPMILQPFIENAIWHGLMPKQGLKKLSIQFKLIDDNMLECIIEDNGIGREAALRLKSESQSGNLHKSRGLGLVYDRLRLLQQQFRKPFTVTLSDITDASGAVSGTRVSLVMYTG